VAERIVIGAPQGLQFEIEWIDDTAAKTAAEATRGRISLWVGEHFVWGKRSGDRFLGLIWTWIELLEFLGNSWQYLLYEEGYPFALQPTSPVRLRYAAESRWLTRPAETVKGEQRELTAFEESHDISRGLQGLFAPSVMLARFGNVFQIGTTYLATERPADETISTLDELGDVIAGRLSGINDERAVQAIKDWQSRSQISKSALASVVTGRSADSLDQIFGGKVEEEIGIANNRFVFSESLALVGLARGILEPVTLSKVVSLVRSEAKVPTAQLDVLSTKALHVLQDSLGLKSYDQGYQLANWLRAQLGMNPTDRVDPQAILHSWGVKVHSQDLATQLLDAIACWGPQHGPAVWLNMNDKHSTSDGARRATLAHEMCHLLVDRAGALPLAEVVNGNIPRTVEQRANAFAAEFLLPRAVTGAAVVKSDDGKTILDDLTASHGVSRELAARQIENSGSVLSQAVREALHPYTLDRRY
jgi:Zn-dependent peptidase ImmA (M78 family)